MTELGLESLHSKSFFSSPLCLVLRCLVFVSDFSFGEMSVHELLIRLVLGIGDWIEDKHKARLARAVDRW